MTTKQDALEALSTLINPHIFLVEKQKIELAEKIRKALTENTWQPIETLPRDTYVHTHGYFEWKKRIPCGGGANYELTSVPMTRYAEHINSNVVYPLRHRCDHEGNDGTYVRTHWKLQEQPPC